MTRNIRLKADAGWHDASGFSLIELLIALTVCALLSGAIAAATPPARALFDSMPEVLDVQQRERTAADVLTRALRSAARLAATREDGTAGRVATAVELLEPDEDGLSFHAVRVIAVADVARGVLIASQASPSAPLQLRIDAPCPLTGDVCGFAKGLTTAIVDVEGHVDVFTVASTNKGAHSLTPAAALNRAYPSGSALWAVSADTYYLEPEADGSLTLVRETVAGAVQPIVDAVARLDLRDIRSAGVLTRVDLVIRVGARSPLPRRVVPARTRRLSVSLRNPS